MAFYCVSYIIGKAFICAFQKLVVMQINVTESTKYSHLSMADPAAA